MGSVAVSVANSVRLFGSEQRDGRGQSWNYLQPSLGTYSSDQSFHKPAVGTYKKGFPHPDVAYYYSGNKKRSITYDRLKKVSNV